MLASVRNPVDFFDKPREWNPSGLARCPFEPAVGIIDAYLGWTKERVANSSENNDVLEGTFTILSRHPDRTILHQLEPDVIYCEKAFVASR